MNVRLVVLAALLAILSVVGFVQFKGSEPRANLPATLSPLARPSRRAPPGSPEVRVAGVMINSPTHTGADPASGDGFGVDLAFFGTFERTRLALELTRAEGGVLGIDDARCRVTRFADDRGTDLARAENPFGPFEMLPRISPDGRHAVLVLPSPRLPRPDATRLFAEGVVGLRVAARKETFTAEGVALSAGSRFSVAGFELAVESAGPSQWGEGHSITLGCGRDLSAIARYALVLEDGAELELRPSLQTSGMGTWQQTLELERAVARAGFRVDVWQDLATLEVPFSVETGLGLR